MSNESIKSQIAVCVNTSNVFNAGYDPYIYINALINLEIPIELIHLTDSRNSWGSNNEIIQELGTGMIPWPTLIKTANFAKQRKIAMISI